MSRKKIVQRENAVVTERAAAGYTLRGLSEVCGVSVNTLTLLENGRGVYPSTAKKIATALNADFKDLFEVV